jgi:hypothetical protein
MRDVYYPINASPTGTLAIVIIGSAVLLTIVGLGLVRAARRSAIARKEAASSHDTTLGLHDGEVVLSGVVEHAPEETVAVRVEITQAGTESESSGSWSHAWTETDRRVIVAPFYLRLPDNTKVRVEPPRDVDVADQLDGKVLVNDTKRVLSAELIPGETLHAHGWLERGGDAMPTGGYRDIAWGWVLRAVNGRMMLSSLPLGDGFRSRARFHRRWSIYAFVVLAIMHASFLPFYSRMFGQAETVTVHDKRIDPYEDSDGNAQESHVLGLTHHNGERSDVSLDEEDWEPAYKGERLPIRRGSYDWDLGAKASLTYPHLIVVLSFPLTMLVLYGHRRVKSRPWYRRKVVDTGQGRLPGS